MKMKKLNDIRRCRLCASEEDFNSFVNIFKEDLELDAKITKLLPVVVMPWDPMSHKICPNCIEKLNFFNDFYEATVKADRFLRTLQPSAPENDLSDLNPVLKIDTPILAKNILKLPPKKRQEICPPSDGRKDTREHQKKSNTLNSFIISRLASKDTILTCRQCYRTFTKQSSAFSHPCVRMEDSEEEKCLPPLKIRLFSMKSGLFVCYICQAPFVEKIKVIEHIRRHIGEAKFEEEKRNNGRQKRKRKKQCLDESDEDENWNDKKKTMKRKRRRRRSSGMSKKKGKTEEATEEWKRSDLYSPTKKTSLEEFYNSEVEKDKETPFGIPEDSVKVSEDISESQKIENKNEEGIKVPEDRISVETTENLENDPNKWKESDEVTILEVINNRAAMNLSYCTFCDKIFATKETLIKHENQHKEGMEMLKTKMVEETFLCSFCAMIFTKEKTLLEHEEYFHVTETEGNGYKKKIRIALDAEFPDVYVEKDCQITKGRGIITITLTASEKKIPEIEFF